MSPGRSCTHTTRRSSTPHPRDRRWPTNDNGSVFSVSNVEEGFRLSHPNDSHLGAVYGFDAGLGGYFIEVRRRRKVTKTYDPLTPGYNMERPLWGALVFLASEGFFTEDELNEALLALEHHDLAELPAHLRRVAEVVTNFKSDSE